MAKHNILDAMQCVCSVCCAIVPIVEHGHRTLSALNEYDAQARNRACACVCIYHLIKSIIIHRLIFIWYLHVAFNVFCFGWFKRLLIGFDSLNRMNDLLRWNFPQNNQYFYHLFRFRVVFILRLWLRVPYSIMTHLILICDFLNRKMKHVMRWH